MPNTTLIGMRCAGAALALGAVLLTGTGCAFDNPPETTQITPATNGISAQVGPMKLEDMLILSYGADQPGRVLGRGIQLVLKRRDRHHFRRFRVAGKDSSQGQRPDPAEDPACGDAGPCRGSPRILGECPAERRRHRCLYRCPAPCPRLLDARIPAVHAPDAGYRRKRPSVRPGTG